MDIGYYPDADAMYVSFRPEPKPGEGKRVTGKELAPGIFVFTDEDGELYGVDIEHHASERVDVSALRVLGLPVEMGADDELGSFVRRLVAEKGETWVADRLGVSEEEIRHKAKH